MQKKSTENATNNTGAVKKIKYYCHRCGEELTPQNSREQSEQWSINGLSAYCIDCEQDYFKHLADCEGAHLALYHSCAAFNVPFKLLALEGAEDEFVNETENGKGWVFYCDKLSEKGEDIKKDEVLSFFEGETNILKLFGKEFTQQDFAKAIQYERSRINALPGTPEQRERWGCNKADKYTSEIYDELDRRYEARKSSYKGQTLTPQMKLTLVKVAKWDYLIDQYVREGNINSAKSLQAMVDSSLASEQMRKKDEKPVEEFRIDALIDSFEKNGLMKDGIFLDYEQMKEVLRIGSFGKKKYDYPVDAADQMLLVMLNTMRKNADLMTLPELPEKDRMVDNYEEFEEEESESYKENREYAKLLPIDRGYSKSKLESSAESIEKTESVAETPKKKSGGRKKKTDKNSGSDTDEVK